MDKGMDRRTFFGLAGVSAASVAAAVGLAGCSPSSNKADQGSSQSASEGAQGASDGSVKIIGDDTSLVKDGATYDISSTETADIVICGAGGTGLAAAVEGASKGKKVVLLEKLNAAGGSTQYAEGVAACESSVQKKMNISLSKSELYNELIDYSHFRANPEVVSSYVKASAETIDILQDAGAKFLTVTAFDPDSIFYTWHIIDGHVGAACVAMEQKAKEAGADIRYETPAVQLLMEDGKVKGVVAQNSDGKHIEIDAPAVIICTGGYAQNPGMIDTFTDFGSDNVNGTGSPGNTGDGIKMALSAGAATDNIGLLMVNGATVPGKGLDSHVNNAATQPYFWVNKSGDRFTAETAVMEFPHAGNALGRQPGGLQFTVFDQDTYDHLVNEGNDVGVGQYVVTGAKLDKLDDEIASDIKEGKVAWKSDDLSDLAKQMGIDPTRFKESVDRYNELCDKGVDEDMYKDARFLRPVKKAPFYGIMSKNTFVITINGIKIDGRMRAIDKDNNPIPGLYIGGVDASGLYGDTYAACAAGAACGFAWTSGRLAADDAVEYVG